MLKMDEDALYLIACCKAKEPLGLDPPWPNTRMRREWDKFSPLDEERNSLVQFLSTLPRDQAARVYVRRKSAQETDHAWKINLSLEVAPTMPAIKRYIGTLYQQLDCDLKEQLLAGSMRNLLIVSALLGVLRPADRIPNYELMMTDHIMDDEQVPVWWRRAFARHNLPQLLREYMPSLRRIFCFMSETTGYVSAIASLGEHFDLYVVKVTDGGFDRSPRAWGMGVRSCLEGRAQTPERVSEIVHAYGCTLVRLAGR